MNGEAFGERNHAWAAFQVIRQPSAGNDIVDAALVQPVDGAQKRQKDLGAVLSGQENDVIALADTPQYIQKQPERMLFPLV